MSATDTSFRDEHPPRLLSRPELAPATGARRVLRGMIGRSYPRVIGSNREKSWLFYDLVLPTLGTISFVFVYKALGAPDRFLGYVIMGGATLAFWMNVMWGMAAQFYWDKQGGNMEIYMTAPCGLPAILLGMAVGGLVATIIRAVVVVTIGALLFDVTYTVSSMGMFVAVLAVAVVALYGLGMALASLFLMWGREAWHMANSFMEPVFLASGFYFPVRSLGYAGGIAASFLPMTLALDALRQLLFGEAHPALLPVRVELAALAGLAVVFFFLARWSLRRMERLARAEGRLSMRY